MSPKRLHHPSMLSSVLRTSLVLSLLKAAYPFTWKPLIPISCQHAVYLWISILPSLHSLSAFRKGSSADCSVSLKHPQCPHCSPRLVCGPSSTVESCLPFDIGNTLCPFQATIFYLMRSQTPWLYPGQRNHPRYRISLVSWPPYIVPFTSISSSPGPPSTLMLSLLL
ncbi:hypothetical protein IW262DRAFT_1374815 [Armillaria fumosa]|nr:hypothetical protein IW262DRAFT_1374815 [Armillaria fumosa]